MFQSPPSSTGWCRWTVTVVRSGHTLATVIEGQGQLPTSVPEHLTKDIRFSVIYCTWYLHVFRIQSNSHWSWDIMGIFQGSKPPSEMPCCYWLQKHAIHYCDVSIINHKKPWHPSHRRPCIFVMFASFLGLGGGRGITSCLVRSSHDVVGFLGCWPSFTVDLTWVGQGIIVCLDVLKYLFLHSS